jgi:hypothetical protein
MVLLGAVSTLVIAILMAATLSMLLFAGRAWRRSRSTRQSGPDADEALRRHPAGRARQVFEDESFDHQGRPPRSPVGPDDDPDFINALEWRIRGGENDPPL